MDNSEKYLKLYTDCIPVKGYRRALIYDLNMQQFQFVPISLLEIIEKSKSHTIREVKKSYGNNFDSVIDEYLNFIQNKDYGFYCDDIEEIKCFPEIELFWDYPAKISNIVIDIDEKSTINICNIISEIEQLGTKNLQLRFYYSYDLKKVSKFLDLLSKSSITIIEIFIKFHKESDFAILNDICDRNPRVKSIVVFNSEKDEIFNEGYYNLGIILKVKQSIISSMNCGNIQSAYFNTSIPLFTESQHYNTCLNRKLCIDTEGNIKNCPAMERSFGNIKDSTLEDALNKEGFKDLWGIRKDDIDVCKDCEFRYMCTDCRCFIKDPSNIYSQPAKCPYNPYIAKWEGEEEYITVEQWRTENPNWEKKAKRKPLVKKPQPVE
ncbi:MAG: grasp-with-spasm system SPASM domain peptide maturase [Bacteroidota bacterium]